MEPNWIDYPALRHTGGGGLYQDILDHYRGQLRYPDRHTVAHETAHMIHSELRNRLGQGFRTAAFYVGGDRAWLTPQPQLRKSQVAALVPQPLRESRYGTYVSGAGEWDDSPLYIYDEWVCYIIGGQVAVEEVAEGTYRSGWTDAVMGLLEFSAYAAATVLAVQQHRPDYCTAQPEFLPFTGYCLRWAQRVYQQGSQLEQFRWDRQDRYLQLLRQDPAAEPLRRVLQQLAPQWLGQSPAPPDTALDTMLIGD